MVLIFNVFLFNLEADSCIPNPCSNNGVCHNVNGGGFTCECPKNFSGGKCEGIFYSLSLFV